MSKICTLWNAIQLKSKLVKKKKIEGVLLL